MKFYMSVIPLCSMRSTHTFSTWRKSLSAFDFFLYVSEDKAKILLMFSNPAFGKEVWALLKFSSISFNNRVIYSIENEVVMWRMIEEIGKDEHRQPIISVSLIFPLCFNCILYSLYDQYVLSEQSNMRKIMELHIVLLFWSLTSLAFKINWFLKT